MTSYARELLIWALFIMAPMIVVTVVAHFCVAAPARRNERARLFLDIVETAVQTGQSVERAIVSVSETRERSVGVQFHLLAARIEEGATLPEALARTPRLLPPNIAEALRIGTTENALPRLATAARAMLDDATSRMRGAMNYLLLFLVVMVPAGLFFIPALSFAVWPKMRMIMEDMEIPRPAFSELVFEHVGFAVAVECLIVAGLLFFGFFYVRGPGRGRMAGLFGAWPDRLLLLLGWRRRRVQRDFTGALAILLDSGVAEPRAVELAAQATANRVFEQRAKKAVAQLGEGVALPEALKALESSNEFQWRWANALRSGKGFFAALRGWHEALESRAFQQEQAAAHAITSGMVLLNGLIVAALTAAVFLIFVQIIEHGVLW